MARNAKDVDHPIRIKPFNTSRLAMRRSGPVAKRSPIPKDVNVSAEK
jgi:hypothetical protein